MSRIFVTGIRGLIGSAVQTALEKCGFAVCGCDLRSSDDAEKFDFRDAHKLRTALKDCNGVLHLGALSRVVWGEKYPALCESINIGGLHTLMSVMTEMPQKIWFVYASSREIYGTPPKLPCSPDTPPNPENLYARTKLAGEGMTQDFRRQGFRTAVVRFSNVFGDVGDYHDRVVPAFAKAASDGGLLHLRGADGIFDFTPLDDAVDAVVRVVQLIAAGDYDLPAIDIVTGRGTSLLELARMALAHGNGDIVMEEREHFYPAYFQGDPSPAKKYLGWVPRESLENAVGRMVYDFGQMGEKKMRILKVIHGYPPLYNAGSEVYSQTLCAELCKRHDVHVFTREENPFVADGVVRRSRDALFPGIKLHIVNAARIGINYKNSSIDGAFARVMRDINPDVVHIGHLNHLSLGIVDDVAGLEIPVVFTLHDFWLMCMRGQFIQVAPSAEDVWPLCEGQENKKCADRCMRRYWGDDAAQNRDWETWVADRMSATRRMAELVDIFIAPSKNLARRFRDEFSLPSHKIEYLDYGFDRRRLSGRHRTDSGNFAFGYIGTHIPGKGVHHLLDAFCLLHAARKDCELRIWGRPTANTAHLKDIVSAMPPATQERIKWMGEYGNSRIVSDVFNHLDAIVVPSIWHENSPLVIHEAQQARVPVITADMGGMAEYVVHEKNGLLFQPRDPAAMAAQMERMLVNPQWAGAVGERGYLYDDNGDVPDIGAHAAAVENLYHRAMGARDAARTNKRRAPWRITFDTNPDHCNYHCTMCEEHSEFSPLQFRRRADGLPKRVMPFDLIARNIELLAKSGLREIIPSTMGEPLLYKRFKDIITLCQKNGVMLNLTTNGSFPTLGAREWAHHLVPVTSDIKISWNGACKKTQEKVMKNADWDNMLANVRAFIAVRDAHAAEGGNRCRVTFQMTFMESNSAELPALISLAASLGVDRVKGHHLWVNFPEIKDEDMRRSPEAMRRWNDIVSEARAAAEKYPLPDGGRVILENIDFLRSDDSQNTRGRCPFLGQEAWISADGRFNPCCAPDAERRSLGEFGNLHETNIRQIWEGDAYQFLLKTYRSREVCQKCNMRKSV